MISIMLVDDHKVVRDGLKYHFEDHSEYDISHEAANGIEALEILKQNNVDIVISDISMPEMDGITLLQEIRKEWPQQKVIALTMLGEVTHIKNMISQGVNGYLLKNSTEEEILKSIDEVMAGNNYFSSEVTQSLIDDLQGKKKPRQRLTLETPLSKREKEVLALIAKEYTNQEIADELFISVRTVDSHKHNLLEKTGAKNVAGLVLYAIEHELI